MHKCIHIFIHTYILISIHTYIHVHKCMCIQDQFYFRSVARKRSVPLSCKSAQKHSSGAGQGTCVYTNGRYVHTCMYECILYIHIYIYIYTACKRICLVARNTYTYTDICDAYIYI